jgi:hypothetical protein
MGRLEKIVIHGSISWIVISAGRGDWGKWPFSVNRLLAFPKSSVPDFNNLRCYWKPK